MEHLFSNDSILPENLKPVVCFLDEIPLFYKLGQKSIKNEIESQIKFIHANFNDVCNILSNLSCVNAGVFMKLESSFTDIISHLETVARQWRV